MPSMRAPSQKQVLAIFAYVDVEYGQQCLGSAEFAPSTLVSILRIRQLASGWHLSVHGLPIAAGKWRNGCKVHVVSMRLHAQAICAHINTGYTGSS